MNKRDSVISIYQLVMLFLCVYVLIANAIDTFFHLQEEVSLILSHVDNLICVFFLFDFCYKMWSAENRLRYFYTWGWIDLISSIPSVALLRWGRFVRVFRIIRLVRSLRSAQKLTTIILQNRSKSVLASVSLLALIFVVVASIVILQVETHPDSNITTASDALWWSISTVTTVGYGEIYPSSGVGRIVGAILMVIGIGLFGTLTALLASWFVGADEEEQMKILLAKMDSMEESMKEIALAVGTHRNSG